MSFSAAVISMSGIAPGGRSTGASTQLIVKLPGEVRMTVLVPNADEAERQKLPGGGAKVKLSWAPEHMHLVRESRQHPTDDKED